MTGAFRGLPLATLQALQTSYVSAVTALASAQSYSIAGRSVTRSDLPSIMDTLAEINAEIGRLQGTRRSVVYAGMNSRL